nr:hypothetical protein GCM10020093_095410 [Planobispora longispora]
MTGEALPVLAGRYRAVERLGAGGMGVVWRARDELLHREVAVKEVNLGPHLPEAQRAEMRERTLREARAAARLSHPSIVAVHDVIAQDGRPWIVMDLVRGHSLEQVIRARGPLPPERVAAIGLAVLDALVLAHSRGILHRDVKPANIMIDRGGGVLLTDFGIATLEGDVQLTSPDALVGSPATSPRSGCAAPATARPPTCGRWARRSTPPSRARGRSSAAPRSPPWARCSPSRPRTRPGPEGSLRCCWPYSPRIRVSGPGEGAPRRPARGLPRQARRAPLPGVLDVAGVPGGSGHGDTVPVRPPHRAGPHRTDRRGGAGRRGGRGGRHGAPDLGRLDDARPPPPARTPGPGASPPPRPPAPC